MMTIQPKDYNSKKEYWDYQRKVEYNREQINMMSERFDGRVYGDFGMVSVDEIKDKLWNKIDPAEYEEPPEDWIPKDPKYQLWYEDGKLDVKQLSPTARKVILRAKKDYERTNELGKKY